MEGGVRISFQMAIWLHNLLLGVPGFHSSSLKYHDTFSSHHDLKHCHALDATPKTCVALALSPPHCSAFSA